MDTKSPNPSSPHILLFPFMSKGHTIPILQLARLLLRRGLTVTIITTPRNRPFIAKSLADTTGYSLIDIPYPENVPEIPHGVESTDALPSISLYPPFCRATKLMQQEFETKLQTLLPVSFIVSDGFLWWTLESAMKFGLPRLVFYGMSQYSASVCQAVFGDRRLLGPESDDELITVTQFPWIKVTKNDFDQMFSKPDPSSPKLQLCMDQVIASSNSYGTLANTFYELERPFIEYVNRKDKHKTWCVGPLCLAQPQPKLEHDHNKPFWIKWLDQKLDQGCSVLYVAFGSQADISLEQIQHIAKGLEESKVNFLWVMKKKSEAEQLIMDAGYEERVKQRGLVVTEWVNQRQILLHQSVRGFVSHCGWNSALESITAGVPILAWPIMAEQPLNARMVVEEIEVGLRVETVKGFVKWEGLMTSVKELMEGEMGEKVRKNVKDVAEKAKLAMDEKCGSSWLTLNLLIDELCNKNSQVTEQ